MKKWTRTGLRLWLAMTSLVGFLFGWIVLAHSGKPAPLINPDAASVNGTAQTLAQPLPPVPSLDQFTSQNNTGRGFQGFTNNSNSQAFNFRAPRLRTMGS